MIVEFFEKYRYKLKTSSELFDQVGPFPRKDKIILCHGLFDVVHPGHVRHLAYAKTKAEILIISITADRHIKKGIYRPHIPEGLRALNLAALEMVDYVIIDECHRGVSNEDGNWREILEYFESATHIGMTATPKTKETVNTYRYFKNPVYTYSLKQGIDDGFLSPYSVIRVVPDVDETGWGPKSGSYEKISGGDIPDKVHKPSEFDRKITLLPQNYTRIFRFSTDKSLADAERKV